MTIADINQEARDLCDADATSYTAATLLRRINNSLEQVVGWIINADGTWEWEDTNYTDLPVGTGDLVQGQETYSFASEYLEIKSIEIKGTDSVYRKILPIDYSELGDVSVQEYFGLNTTGAPTHYDIIGDSIRLYPAPTSTAVTLTAGLKVRFTRTADLFTSAQVTTGTKVPGLPSPYHIILSYMAAIPYCQSYKQDRVGLYKKEVESLKNEIIKFFAHREKDKRKIITTKSISFR